MPRRILTTSRTRRLDGLHHLRKTIIADSLHTFIAQLAIRKCQDIEILGRERVAVHQSLGSLDNSQQLRRIGCLGGNKDLQHINTRRIVLQRAIVIGKRKTIVQMVILICRQRRIAVDISLHQARIVIWRRVVDRTRQDRLIIGNTLRHRKQWHQRQ